MTPEELIETVRLIAFDPAVDGIERQLRDPPGRAPHETLLKASGWYLNLPERDRAYVRWVARAAAYAAVFHSLAMLDGVAAYDDSGGELRLVYRNAEGEETQLNQPEIRELHDLWVGEVFPYTDDLPD